MKGPHCLRHRSPGRWTTRPSTLRSTCTSRVRPTPVSSRERCSSRAEAVRSFARGYGEADRETHAANTPATRFNIGSINKSFTQMAIAQLIAAGRLKATDTIGSLLPDYPNVDARAATVQQLLDHRGGIADFFGPTFVATPKETLRSNADYYRLVAPQPLTFAPGTRRAYCNGCYIVLGEIIARVSGQSYEAYVVEHVFTPAGMARTAFVMPQPRPADVAQGYTTRGGNGGGAARSNAGMIGAGGSAAGGAYSTVDRPARVRRGTPIASAARQGRRGAAAGRGRLGRLAGHGWRCARSQRPGPDLRRRRRRGARQSGPTACRTARRGAVAPTGALNAKGRMDPRWPTRPFGRLGQPALPY